jgi:1-acyl-sn-glycerol-3-phosphate acyltransferase
VQRHHATEPCGSAARAIGRSFLRALGWRVAGAVPPYPKFVVIGAPHTSNWDLPILLASSWTLGVHLHWLAKRELFAPAVRRTLEGLGGIPVDRSAPQGLVGQLVERFERVDRLALMVPPDGTRARREAWRSGFYQIALGAGVPVVASYADYRRREAGIAGSVRLSGVLRDDMDAIRALYRDVTPRHPELATPIRLPAEDTAP